MKRYIVAFALVLVLVLALTASPILAKGEKAQGAVKVDLMQYEPNLDDPVGTVIMGTTASGCLNILINISLNGTAWEDYDVHIFVLDEDGPLIYNVKHPDVLSTNAQGQGNLKFRLCESDGLTLPTDDEIIKVQVSIRENIPGPTPFIETAGGRVTVPLK